MQILTKEAYSLFHAGSLALAEMERNGIRVDEAYLKGAIKNISRDIRRCERKLQADKEIYPAWVRTFRRKTNLRSRTQLGEVLFNVLKHPCNSFTESGRPKTDDATLDLIRLPFVETYRRIERLHKARGTYLYGIKEELVDGFLHPMFSLAGGSSQDEEEDRGGTRSFRSSSSKNNFQNQPVREPEMAEIIRRCYIPRKGRRLVEVDKSQIEVRIAACYCKDPNLIRYIKDPATDMHRDMAMEIYKLRAGELKDSPSYKAIRHSAKNQFVFPEFYGSVWFNVAPNLWEAIGKRNLLHSDGVSLHDHLSNKGIVELGSCDPKAGPTRGTFAAHVKKVEDRFWGEKFKVYAQWKRDRYEDYLQCGYFDLFTGFRIANFHKRNDVTNYPVQGAAFHCLLWSIIEIQNEIWRRKMRTKLVGQIHDSLISDVPVEEFDDYIELAVKVMTKRLPKAWPWIIVPLGVEVEAGDVDCSWHEKKKVEIG